MRPRRAVLLLVASLAAAPLLAQTSDDRGFDPTGVWYGQQGPLVLVRAGDTLSFSYSGVFGATAHICDGIGVAGFVGDGTWEYVDDEGTVTFTTKGGTVSMEATKGIASFCGANWPGATFTKEGWKPAFSCTVTTPKARFLTVAPSPEPRKGFVVKGDVVEAVGLVNESTPAWLLVRYVGKKQTTAGLLERDALECREE
ncbi:MAG TPA: hypothetical protein PLP50_01615 [Thermoanaerobaculia bacterium]|nr:hypothetical protein [Thermoanaerobaculia bacterium]HQN06771.1 hypothetical protein [Thermoanaerobaculia bacterium]HQP84947.1 hypothetical protein [Thermoanaerobaculia bacterium]